MRLLQMFRGQADTAVRNTAITGRYRMLGRRMLLRTTDAVSRRPPRIPTATSADAYHWCVASNVAPSNPLLIASIGTSTFQVHLSGFSTGDMVYLKRLLRAMGRWSAFTGTTELTVETGGTLSLKLNRQTTHLVCAAPTGQKYEKSLEWGESVVQDTWLFAMGRSGRIEPEADHRHSLTLPATGRSGQKLTGKTGCTSNMSMVSDLSHPVDFARIKSALVLPGTSSSAPPKPLSQQSISPSRKLQLTPTHIDGASFSGSAVLARGSVGHALSPPEPETERLLNQASPQSIDSRFARTTSAPPALSPRSREKRETPLFKAATMSSGVGRKEDMTEVLRQLAQTDQTTPGSRARIVRISPNRLTDLG